MSAISSTNELPLKFGLLKRRAGQSSLEAFSRLFLGKHFTLPPSAMHKEIFAILQLSTRERNSRFAIAAPRGHAKSTVASLAYVLWCVCYRYEPYIVIISNTADQAVDLLTAIKDELESNPLLIECFPDVTEPPGSKPGPERWRKNDKLHAMV